jgi:ESS family glutamate:Na+ symporter
MEEAEVYSSEDVQKTDEIPMNGSIDKLTVQLGFVFGSYFIAYILIMLLGNLVGGLKSVLYGFNFLFGVMVATLVNFILGKLKKGKILQKQYINEFLMKRISGFFFDLMIVAGIAAIKIEMIKEYWLMIVILGLVGAFATFFYNRIVAKTLFKGYAEEQFLAMYGMLTGTASTGIILLREIDKEFKTPAAENLVYQNFPAIVLGFPIMLLAATVPKQPVFVLLIMAGLFVVLNLILFRSLIFRKKKKE